MAALAFCIDTGRRDLENARMVAIRTDGDGNDIIMAPCDNDFKEGKPPVIQLLTCTSWINRAISLTTPSFSNSGAVLLLHSKQT